MATITECISSANKSIGAVGENFVNSVKCSGIEAANFTSIFEVKMDSNIENALEEFRKEVIRIEEEIAECNRKIVENQVVVDEMTSKINSCEDQLRSSNHQLRSLNSEIDSLKREISRAKDETAKEEAEENLKRVRRSKDNLESARRSQSGNLEEYKNQQSAARNLVDEYEGIKRNSEKRLDQVNDIIKLI